MDNVVKELSKGIFCITEDRPGGVSAYLVVGTEKALLIDSLFKCRTLYDTCRGLTDLPLEVALTHGHWDHAGEGLHEFAEAGVPIYLLKKDYFFFEDPDFSHALHGLKSDILTPLGENQVFDLGGFRLETITVEGHTPGSCCFLEVDKQIIFTGDSTGAGVFFMQLPGAQPLTLLQKSFKKLWDRIKDMNDLILHPGHRNQSPVQLHLGFIADTIMLTNKIIAGDPDVPTEDREMQSSSGHVVKCKSASYNLITNYCYRPDNITG